MKTLSRLLELRFGSLDATVTARLESAKADALDRYAERLLTAASVEDVFAA